MVILQSVGHSGCSRAKVEKLEYLKHHIHCVYSAELLECYVWDS